MSNKLNNSRKEQIAESWAMNDRNEFFNNLLVRNKEILDKIWSEKIEIYLVEKMKRLSIDELENLKYLLSVFHWKFFDNNASFYNNLYWMLVTWILLPEYVKDWQQEDVNKEIDNIIGRVLNKMNVKLLWKNNFLINMWDYDSFVKELQHTWLQDRFFEIGWKIPFNTFYANPDIWCYESLIPLRISEVVKKTQESENEVKSKDVKKQKNLVNLISQDYLKDFIVNFFAAKPKNWTIVLNWDFFDWKYSWFVIETKKVVDEEGNHGWNVGDIYNSFLISHPDLSIDFDFSMFAWEFFDLFEKFLELNVLVINELMNKFGGVESKKIYTFSTKSLLFQKKIESDTVINEELNEKFKHMLLKVKTPVYFSEVGWQDEAKQKLKDIVVAFKNEQILKSWATKPTSWIIFEWPSWTGKTLLAKATASEIDAEVYNIKLTDIATNAFINSWANNIANLFKFIRQKATKEKKKIVVILDELDALFKKRSWERQSDEDKKIVNVFLSELNWFDDLENVIFIWTTNNIHDIDDAVLRSGRMSVKIKVWLPDEKWLEEIYNVHINKAKKATKRKIFSEDIDIKLFTKKSKWLTWADIEDIIRETLFKKAMLEIGGNINEELIVKNEDIIKTIEEFLLKTKGKKKIIWFDINEVLIVKNEDTTKTKDKKNKIWIDINSSN